MSELHFFSRHAVDKEVEDFGNDEQPSNGYISWLLWGGDTAYEWARRKREVLKNHGEYQDET